MATKKTPTPDEDLKNYAVTTTPKAVEDSRAAVSFDADPATLTCIRLIAKMTDYSVDNAVTIANLEDQATQRGQPLPFDALEKLAHWELIETGKPSPKHVRLSDRGLRLLKQYEAGKVDIKMKDIAPPKTKQGQEAQSEEDKEPEDDSKLIVKPRKKAKKPKPIPAKQPAKKKRYQVFAPPPDKSDKKEQYHGATTSTVFKGGAGRARR